MSIGTPRVRNTTLIVAVMLLLQGCVTAARVEKLGKEEAAKVESTMGILHKADLEAYVTGLGLRLAAASDRPRGPWSFQIVDAPEPNAFALPGGYVFVSRGLLSLVNSEDELAGVIGHEIGHVTAAHAEKRIRAAVATSPISIATGLAGFATGIVSPSLGRMVSVTGQVLTSGLVISPYGRSQENEADEIGQGLAAKSGYDPAGISHFLQTLDREETLVAGKQRRPSFLDTHPMTPDRVERTQQRAATLQRVAGVPLAKSRSDLFAKLDGIVVGEDPAQGIFQENVFLHPELNIVLSFPVAWKTMNTPTSVGATSPSEDAALAATIAEKDASLSSVLEKLQAEQPELKFERFQIRDLPAARTRASDRNRFIEFTLIGYRGDVYSILGQSAGANAAQYAKTFQASVQSFRPLSASERRSLEESRLRVRNAQAGETPAALAKRTGSHWSAEQIAVANATQADATLKSGQPVKVAIPQPYTPR